MSVSNSITILGTPIYNFLKGEWASISANMDSIEVEENDFVLYVLWTIDSLRDSDSRPALLKTPWTSIRMAIRSHLRKQGYKNVKADLDCLTDAVCGYTLYCWGFVLADAAMDSQTNQEAFMTFEHNLGEHWKNVQGLLNTIQYESSYELRQWMMSYVNGDVFFTISEEMGWNTVTLSAEDQVLVAIPQGKCQNPTIINFNQEVTLEKLNINGNTQIGTLIGKAEKVNTDNGE